MDTGTEDQVAECAYCNKGPIPEKTLDRDFMNAQIAAVQMFAANEPISGHTNGCILQRMVNSGLHPDISLSFINVMRQPKIIMPGEVVN